jgi:glucokinase
MRENSMPVAKNHVLIADIGGTNTRIAIFAQQINGKIEPVRHKVYASRKISSIPSTLKEFLRIEGRNLVPKIEVLCVGFAGPVGPTRSEARMTNLPWSFYAEEVLAETGLQSVVLLNDFEAVGFGLEILVANKPEAFVRLSRSGSLSKISREKPTIVVIGAGTGLGTAILTPDSESGKYMPIPGEGGHSDFIALDEFEFQVMQWLRQATNQSPDNPLEWEAIVSGPGLNKLYQAIAALEPQLEKSRISQSILRVDPRRSSSPDREERASRRAL